MDTSSSTTTDSGLSSSVSDQDILGPAQESARMSALSAEANSIMAEAKAKSDAQIGVDNAKKAIVESISQGCITGAQGSGRLIAS